VRVAIDYPALKSAGAPVGLSLRIGPYNGVFTESDANAVRICQLAESLVERARSQGLTPAELQIDFDCAEAKLEGYQLWVRALRRRVAPVPLTITALPSWLHRPSFAVLAGATDGYVLQVHSLARPSSIQTPMTLCDSAGAIEAVERAGKIGVPFRVALPTYGYLVAFDRDGRFAGLSAEGPSGEWPSAAQVRALRADPAAMAALVSRWTARRPACMNGIIWYRLPVAGDSLNWRWATLEAVMAGRVPQPGMSAVVRKPEPLVYEVVLENSGESDGSLGGSVVVCCDRSAIVAADALGGFEQTSAEGRTVFRPTPALATDRLAPGDRRTIGWMRLSQDREVTAYVKSNDP